MSLPLLVLEVPREVAHHGHGQSLGERIAQRATGECLVRGLDLSRARCADGRPEPVTVRGTRAAWGGVDLDQVGAVLVDAPVFPWPQPGESAHAARDRAELDRASAADREWRALAGSALAIAAWQVPLWNPVSAARWAASPALALVELEARGIDVGGWECGEFAPEERGADRSYLPATGRTASLTGQGRSAPEVGDSGPVLSISAAAGAAQLLVVDGEAIAQGAWRPCTPGGAPEQASAPRAGAHATLAAEAARCLALPLASVVVVEREGAPAVAFFDAAPDLVAWDDATDGLAIDRTLAGLERAAAARGALLP